MPVDLCGPPPAALVRVRAQRTTAQVGAHAVGVSTKGNWPRAVFLAWLDGVKEQLGAGSDNQLATVVGIPHPSVISNWRRGTTQPDYDNLRRLATAAGVTPAYVFTLAGRLQEGDLEENPSPVVEPLPDVFRELETLFRRSDKEDRAMITQQMEFIIRAVAGRTRQGAR